MNGDTPSGYWYGDRSYARPGVPVLTAMREYRSAEAAMRKRTRSTMRMGETDLSALRMLLQAQRIGRTMAPKELAEGLGISSASTTILLDRLERSGHIERLPHPSDGRSIVVHPTAASETEVRATLGAVHERMMAIAEALEPEQAAVIVDFLASMRRAVTQVDRLDPSELSDQMDPDPRAKRREARD